MAITVNMIEELAQWCLRSDALADVRSQAMNNKAEPLAKQSCADV